MGFLGGLVLALALIVAMLIALPSNKIPTAAVAAIGALGSVGAFLVGMLGSWLLLVNTDHAHLCVMGPCEPDARWVDEAIFAVGALAALAVLALTGLRIARRMNTPTASPARVTLMHGPVSRPGEGGTGQP